MSILWKTTKNNELISHIWTLNAVTMTVLWHRATNSQTTIRVSPFLKIPHFLHNSNSYPLNGLDTFLLNISKKKKKVWETTLTWRQQHLTLPVYLRLRFPTNQCNMWICCNIPKHWDFRCKIQIGCTFFVFTLNHVRWYATKVLLLDLSKIKKEAVQFFGP